MTRKMAWLLGVLLAGECALSFAAGGLSYSLAEQCREEAETPAVEEIGIRGVWYKLEGDGWTVYGATRDDAVSEALARSLPEALHFTREGDLLTAALPAPVTAGAVSEEAGQAGDLLYLPGSGEVEVVLADGTGAAGHRIGRLPSVETLQQQEQVDMTWSIGR